MTIIHKDITLKFPFDCDYSLNGRTWIRIRANTEVVISSDDLDPNTRKVTVRSKSNDATTLSRDSLKLLDSRFKEINIRNGSKLTNLDSFLRQCVVDNFYINYAPVLESATHMCTSGIFKNINLCELPKLTNITSCFADSRFEKIGNLNFGRLNSPSYTEMGSLFNHSIGNIVGSVTCERAGDLNYLFDSSKINGIGHIDLTSPVEYTYDDISTSYIFNSSNFDCFPSASFTSKANTNNKGWSYNSFMFFLGSNNFSRAGYLPTISLNMNTPSQITYNSSYDFFFESSNLDSLKIGGISIKDMRASGDSFFEYATSGMSGTKTLEKFKSMFSNINLVNHQTLGNGNEHTLYGFLTEINTYRPYYDNPDWFPVVEYIHTKTNSELVNTVGTYSVGMYNRSVKNNNGIKYYSNKQIEPIYECSFSGDETAVSNDGSTAIFCQNGNYAYQSGADILIKDSDNVLLSTITNKTLITGNFNSDGTKLYLVFGGSINKTGTEGQNIVNTISVFNTTTGEQIGADITTTNTTDEYVSGVYKAHDDYGLKIIKTKYELNAGTGSYQWLSSKCESIFANNDYGAVQATKDIPIDVGYVGNHYIESYEFVCVDPITGKTARMIGK